MIVSIYVVKWIRIPAIIFNQIQWGIFQSMLKINVVWQIHLTDSPKLRNRGCVPSIVPYKRFRRVQSQFHNLCYQKCFE